MTAPLPSLPADSASRYYSIPQLAQAIGLSESCLRQWVHSGQLRCLRAGPRGAMRIRLQDLQELIDRLSSGPSSTSTVEDALRELGVL